MRDYYGIPLLNGHSSQAWFADPAGTLPCFPKKVNGALR
jgi:hypothetical protein